MAIEFRIVGPFEMTFQNYHTKQDIVEKDIEQGILDNLQQGEYVISLNNNTVLDINDLENPLYSFLLDSSCGTEYEFDEP